MNNDQINISRSLQSAIDKMTVDCWWERIADTPSVSNYKSIQKFWRVKPSQKFDQNCREKHKDL